MLNSLFQIYKITKRYTAELVCEVVRCSRYMRICSTSHKRPLLEWGVKCSPPEDKLCARSTFLPKSMTCLCFVSALLVSGGVALYPIGWDNREVRDCCGTSSHVYRLGIYLLFIQNLRTMKVIVNVVQRYKWKVKIYVLQPKTCPCSHLKFFRITITQEAVRPNTGG